MATYNKRSGIVRAISLFVATVFTVTTLVSSPSEAQAVASTFEFLSRNTDITQLRQGLSEIPGEWGTLNSFWKPSANDASKPFVIHIQDIHSNPDAAQNIASILGFLNEKHPGMLIGLEGAVGELHPEYLNFFSDYPEANLAVVSDLKRKGELNGAELYLLNQSGATRNAQRATEGQNSLSVERRTLRAPEVHGIETPALYRDNLKTYRQLLEKRNVMEKPLAAIRSRLDSESSQKLNADLRGFLKERSRRKEGRYNIAGATADPNLQAYADYLNKQALKFLKIDLADPIEQLRFPNLMRVLRLSEDCQKFDAERIQREWNEVLKTLTDTAKDSGEQDFVAALTTFAREQGFVRETVGREFSYPIERALYPRKLLEGLFLFKQKHPIDLTRYAAFLKSWELVTLQAEIEVAELMKEMTSLEDQMILSFAKTDEEKKLVTRIEQSDLLGKLLRLELTRPEYDEAVSSRNALEAFAAEQKKLVPFLEQAFHFYEVSLKRDSALVENLLNLPDGEGRRAEGAKTGTPSTIHHPPSVFVLYTGGFHSSGIEEILREKGIGYAEIAPKTRSVDYGELYQKVIAGDNADLTAYFKVKNPFATKQEALFFKELIETAAPALFEKYQLKPGQIANDIKRSVENHPVLSKVVAGERAANGEASAIIFRTWSRAPKQSANSAVMPPATLSDALTYEFSQGTAATVPASAVVKFGSAEALTVNISTVGQRDLPSTIGTVQMGNGVVAQFGTLTRSESRADNVEKILTMLDSQIALGDDSMLNKFLTRENRLDADRYGEFPANMFMRSIVDIHAALTRKGSPGEGGEVIRQRNISAAKTKAVGFLGKAARSAHFFPGDRKKNEEAAQWLRSLEKQWMDVGLIDHAGIVEDIRRNMNAETQVIASPELKQKPSWFSRFRRSEARVSNAGQALHTIDVPIGFGTPAGKTAFGKAVFLAVPDQVDVLYPVTNENFETESQRFFKLLDELDAGIGTFFKDAAVQRYIHDWLADERKALERKMRAVLGKNTAEIFNPYSEIVEAIRKATPRAEGPQKIALKEFFKQVQDKFSFVAVLVREPEWPEDAKERKQAQVEFENDKKKMAQDQFSNAQRQIQKQIAEIERTLKQDQATQQRASQFVENAKQILRNLDAQLEVLQHGPPVQAGASAEAVERLKTSIQKQKADLERAQRTAAEAKSAEAILNGQLSVLRDIRDNHLASPGLVGQMIAENRGIASILYQRVVVKVEATLITLGAGDEYMASTLGDMTGFAKDYLLALAQLETKQFLSGDVASEEGVILFTRAAISPLQYYALRSYYGSRLQAIVTLADMKEGEEGAVLSHLKIVMQADNDPPILAIARKQDYETLFKELEAGEVKVTDVVVSISEEHGKSRVVINPDDDTKAFFENERRRQGFWERAIRATLKALRLTPSDEGIYANVLPTSVDALRDEAVGLDRTELMTRRMSDALHRFVEALKTGHAAFTQNETMASEVPREVTGSLVEITKDPLCLRFLGVMEEEFGDALTKQSLIGKRFRLRAWDFRQDKNKELYDVLYEAGFVSDFELDAGFDLYRKKVGQLLLILQLTALFNDMVDLEGKQSANPEVVFPMVRSPRDLDYIQNTILPVVEQLAAKRLIDQGLTEIESAGKVRAAREKIVFGAMIETIDAAHDNLVAIYHHPLAKVFNVGLNDLRVESLQQQLSGEAKKLVAVFRDDPWVKHMLKEIDPRFAALIINMVRVFNEENEKIGNDEAARKKWKSLCFCGEKAADPSFTPWMNFLQDTYRYVPLSRSMAVSRIPENMFLALKLREIQPDTFQRIFSEFGPQTEGQAEALVVAKLKEFKEIMITIQEWNERYAQAGYQHAFFRSDIDVLNGVGSATEFVHLKKIIRALLDNEERKGDLAALQLTENENVAPDELKRILDYLVENKLLVEERRTALLEAYEFLSNVKQIYLMKDPNTQKQKYNGPLYPANINDFLNDYEAQFGRPAWLSPLGSETRPAEFYKAYYGHAWETFQGVTRVIHEHYARLFKPTYKDRQVVDTVQIDGQPHEIMTHIREGLAFHTPRGFTEDSQKYVHIEDADALMGKSPTLMFRLFEISAEQMARLSHRVQWAIAGWFSKNGGNEANASVAQHQEMKQAFGRSFLHILSLDKNVTYPVWRMYLYKVLDKYLPDFALLQNRFIEDGRRYSIGMQTLRTFETMERLYDDHDSIFGPAGEVFRKIRSDPKQILTLRLAVFLDGIMQIMGEVSGSWDNFETTIGRILSDLGIHQDKEIVQQTAWLVYHHRGFKGKDFLFPQEMAGTIDEIFKSPGFSESLFSMLYVMAFAFRAATTSPESMVMLPRQGSDSSSAKLDELYLAGKSLIDPVTKKPQIDGDRVKTAIEEAIQEVAFDRKNGVDGMRKNAIREKAKTFIQEKNWRGVVRDYLAFTNIGKDVSGKYASVEEGLSRALTDPVLFDQLFASYTSRVSVYYMETLSDEEILKEMLFFKHLELLSSGETKDVETVATAFFPLSHHYNQAYEILVGFAKEDKGLLELAAQVSYQNGFYIENVALRNPPNGPSVVRILGYFPQGIDGKKIQTKIKEDFAAIFKKPSASATFFQSPFRGKTPHEFRFKNADKLYGADLIIPKKEARGFGAVSAVFSSKVENLPHGQGNSLVIRSSVGWRGQLLATLIVLTRLHKLNVLGLKFEHAAGEQGRTILYLNKNDVALSDAEMASVQKDLTDVLDMETIHFRGDKIVRSELRVGEVARQSVQGLAVAGIAGSVSSFFRSEVRWKTPKGMCVISVDAGERVHVYSRKEYLDRTITNAYELARLFHDLGISLVDSDGTSNDQEKLLKYYQQHPDEQEVRYGFSVSQSGRIEQFASYHPPLDIATALYVRGHPVRMDQTAGKEVRVKWKAEKLYWDNSGLNAPPIPSGGPRLLQAQALRSEARERKDLTDDQFNARGEFLNQIAKAPMPGELEQIVKLLDEFRPLLAAKPERAYARSADGQLLFETVFKLAEGKGAGRDERVQDAALEACIFFFGAEEALELPFRVDLPEGQRQPRIGTPENFKRAIRILKTVDNDLLPKYYGLLYEILTDAPWLATPEISKLFYKLYGDRPRRPPVTQPILVTGRSENPSTSIRVDDDEKWVMTEMARAEEDNLTSLDLRKDLEEYFVAMLPEGPVNSEQKEAAGFDAVRGILRTLSKQPLNSESAELDKQQAWILRQWLQNTVRYSALEYVDTEKAARLMAEADRLKRPPTMKDLRDLLKNAVTARVGAPKRSEVRGEIIPLKRSKSERLDFDSIRRIMVGATQLRIVQRSGVTYSIEQLQKGTPEQWREVYRIVQGGKSLITVGRSQSNDIVLGTDPEVSGQHLSIHLFFDGVAGNDLSIVVEDRGSLNGTRIEVADNAEEEEVFSGGPSTEAPEEGTLAGPFIPKGDTGVPEENDDRIVMDVPPLILQVNEVRPNPRYHNPGVSPEVLDEIAKAVSDVFASQISVDDKDILLRALQGRQHAWIFGNEAISDFILHKVHSMTERSYKEKNLTLREYIRAYLKDVLAYLKAPTLEKQGVLAKQYLYFAKKALKPYSRLTLIHGHAPPNFHFVNDLAAVTPADPEQFTVNRTIYKFKKGRFFRGEELPPEKLVFAKWRGRTFLFYKSATHRIPGLSHRVWRYAPAYFTMKGGWLVKETPENLADASPEFGLLLDEIVRQTESHTADLVTDNDLPVKKMEELGLVNFIDGKALDEMFAAKSPDELWEIESRMSSAGKRNPQIKEAERYKLRAFGVTSAQALLAKTGRWLNAVARSEARISDGTQTALIRDDKHLPKSIAADFMILSPILNAATNGKLEAFTNAVEKARENGYLSRLIFVDDGSSDGTFEMLREDPAFKDVFFISFDRNQQKEGAVAATVKYLKERYGAFPEYFVTLDADSFFEPAEGTVIGQLEGAVRQLKEKNAALLKEGRPLYLAQPLEIAANISQNPSLAERIQQVQWWNIMRVRAWSERFSTKGPYLPGGGEIYRREDFLRAIEGRHSGFEDGSLGLTDRLWDEGRTAPSLKTLTVKTQVEKSWTSYLRQQLRWSRAHWDISPILMMINLWIINIFVAVMLAVTGWDSLWGLSGCAVVFVGLSLIFRLFAAGYRNFLSQESQEQKVVFIRDILPYLPLEMLFQTLYAFGGMNIAVVQVLVKKLSDNHTPAVSKASGARSEMRVPGTTGENATKVEEAFNLFKDGKPLIIGPVGGIDGETEYHVSVTDVQTKGAVVTLKIVTITKQGKQTSSIKISKGDSHTLLERPRTQGVEIRIGDIASDSAQVILTAPPDVSLTPWDASVYSAPEEQEYPAEPEMVEALKPNSAEFRLEKDQTLVIGNNTISIRFLGLEGKEKEPRLLFERVPPSMDIRRAGHALDQHSYQIRSKMINEIQALFSKESAIKGTPAILLNAREGKSVMIGTSDAIERARQGDYDRVVILIFLGVDEATGQPQFKVFCPLGVMFKGGLPVEQIVKTHILPPVPKGLIRTEKDVQIAHWLRIVGAKPGDEIGIQVVKFQGLQNLSAEKSSQEGPSVRFTLSAPDDWQIFQGEQFDRFVHEKTLIVPREITSHPRKGTDGLVKTRPVGASMVIGTNKALNLATQKGDFSGIVRLYVRPFDPKTEHAKFAVDHSPDLSLSVSLSPEDLLKLRDKLTAKTSAVMRAFRAGEPSPILEAVAALDDYIETLAGLGRQPGADEDLKHFTAAVQHFFKNRLVGIKIYTQLKQKNDPNLSGADTENYRKSVEADAALLGNYLGKLQAMEMLPVRDGMLDLEANLPKRSEAREEGENISEVERPLGEQHVSLEQARQVKKIFVIGNQSEGQESLNRDLILYPYFVQALFEKFPQAEIHLSIDYVSPLSLEHYAGRVRTVTNSLHHDQRKVPLESPDGVLGTVPIDPGAVRDALARNPRKLALWLFQMGYDYVFDFTPGSVGLQHQFEGYRKMSPTLKTPQIFWNLGQLSEKRDGNWQNVSPIEMFNAGGVQQRVKGTDTAAITADTRKGKPPIFWEEVLRTYRALGLMPKGRDLQGLALGVLAKDRVHKALSEMFQAKGFGEADSEQAIKNDRKLVFADIFSEGAVKPDMWVNLLSRMLNSQDAYLVFASPSSKNPQDRLVLTDIIEKLERRHPEKAAQIMMMPEMSVRRVIEFMDVMDLAITAGASTASQIATLLNIPQIEVIDDDPESFMGRTYRENSVTVGAGPLLRGEMFGPIDGVLSENLSRQHPPVRRRLLGISERKEPDGRSSPGVFRKVLFADDDEVLGYIMPEYLKEFGVLEVTVVKNGEEALAEFSKDPQTYDLIVTDINMPKMDGFQFIEKAMALRVVPFVVVSGHDVGRVTEERSAAWAGQNLKFATLAKPFTFKDVEATLNQVRSEARNPDQKRILMLLSHIINNAPLSNAGMLVQLKLASLLERPMADIVQLFDVLDLENKAVDHTLYILEKSPEIIFYKGAPSYGEELARGAAVQKKFEGDALTKLAIEADFKGILDRFKDVIPGLKKYAARLKDPSPLLAAEITDIEALGAQLDEKLTELRARMLSPRSEVRSPDRMRAEILKLNQGIVARLGRIGKSSPELAKVVKRRVKINGYITLADFRDLQAAFPSEKFLEKQKSMEALFDALGERRYAPFDGEPNNQVLIDYIRRAGALWLIDLGRLREGLGERQEGLRTMLADFQATLRGWIEKPWNGPDQKEKKPDYILGIFKKWHQHERDVQDKIQDRFKQESGVAENIGSGRRKEMFQLAEGLRFMIDAARQIRMVQGELPLRSETRSSSFRTETSLKGARVRAEVREGEKPGGRILAEAEYLVPLLENQWQKIKEPFRSKLQAVVVRSNFDRDGYIMFFQKQKASNEFSFTAGDFPGQEDASNMAENVNELILQATFPLGLRLKAENIEAAYEAVDGWFQRRSEPSAPPPCRSRRVSPSSSGGGAPGESFGGIYGPARTRGPCGG